MNLIRPLMVPALLLVSGCHFLHLRSDCHDKQEYQRAAQSPPLKVPAGLDAPSAASPTALVIPAVPADIPRRGPKEACLEEPPKYKAGTPNKPLPQS